MTDTKSSTNEKSASVFTLNDFNSKTNLTSSEKKAQYEEYYDLEEHRVNGASSKSALAHLMKSSLGSGILAMPMAFANAGLLFGSVATLVVGILCAHCVHILVKTSQSLSRELRVPCLNYADTAYKAFESGPQPTRRFATFAQNFVDIGMMCTYYAASSVYIVFIATSIHDVVNYDLDIHWDVRIYIALTMIPCLFIGQIRNLKYLVPFSTMANIFIVVVFGITLYYMFNEPLNFDDKVLIAPISKVPVFFATVVFAMEGIGIVMPVENSMQRPQDFLGCPGVLNIAMSVVVIFYGVIGFFGYVRFGDDVRGSITLNLPMGAPLADVAKIVMALAILFTYGLQYYIPNELFWNRVKHRFNEKNHNRAAAMIRTGFVLLTGAFGILIPNLEPFISLIGAIFFSLIGLTAPAVIETVYLWPNLGWCHWKLIKNILCVIFSLFAMSTGTWISVKEIIAIYD